MIKKKKIIKRSPSPEPIYGADGKRINTREYRYRKKLEDERHKLIEEGQKRFKDFKPPADYKKSNKHVEKVNYNSLLILIIILLSITVIYNKINTYIYQYINYK